MSKTETYLGRVRVTNLRTLEQEKYRMKLLCRGMEDQLQDRISYLKGNYGVMTFNSVFPTARKKGDFFKWALKLGGSAWKKGRKKRSLLTMLLFSAGEFLLMRTGTNFIERFFGEKRSHK